MKVCPVCQYEEESDDETSCSICGSDLGTNEEEVSTSENIIQEEKPAATESAEVPSTKETEETKTEETQIDEEKLLEETLAATAVTESKDDGKSANFISQISGSITL